MAGDHVASVICRCDGVCCSLGWITGKKLRRIARRNSESMVSNGDIENAGCEGGFEIGARWEVASLLAGSARQAQVFLVALAGILLKLPRYKNKARSTDYLPR